MINFASWSLLLHIACPLKSRPSDLFDFEFSSHIHGFSSGLRSLFISHPDTYYLIFVHLKKVDIDSFQTGY